GAAQQDAIAGRDAALAQEARDARGAVVQLAVRGRRAVDLERGLGAVLPGGRGEALVERARGQPLTQGARVDVLAGMPPPRAQRRVIHRPPPRAAWSRTTTRGCRRAPP